MPARARAVAEAARRFQRQGHYDWPAAPTETLLKRMLARLKRELPGDHGTDPLVGDEALDRTAPERIRRIAPDPTDDPLRAPLEATFNEWAESWREGEGSGERLQVALLPPGAPEDTLARWAVETGRSLLAPPARESLLREGRAALPEGSGLLVVPALERWFLRHRKGLGRVRNLLRDLREDGRPALIGCSSWAWPFLAKAADVPLLLAEPTVPPAWDADALRDWIGDLAAAGEADIRHFRLAETGEDVFAVDEDGEARCSYFARLAAQSFGIPQVALALWREALRDRPDPEGDAAAETSDPEHTIWIAAPEAYAMPGTGDGTALLVLHALLIHGALDAGALRLVLPSIEAANIVPALERAGFVRVENGEIACRTAAYPAIRRALDEAGFPMDEL